MDLQREFDLLLRSRYALIAAVTHEEPRVLSVIKDLCLERERPGYVWDLADGFEPLTDKDTPIQSGSDALTVWFQSTQ